MKISVFLSKYVRSMQGGLRSYKVGETGKEMEWGEKGGGNGWGRGTERQ